VRVLSSPAGQATHTFALPFSDLEIENFLLRIGRPRSGVRRLESPQMYAAQQFGGQLFAALLGGDVRLCFNSSLNEARDQDKGLRLRLRLTDVPELADLPWEFLYNTSLDRFLVLSAETPIVRSLDLLRDARPLTVKPPLRVLVMIASPRDYEQLDVEREWANLTTALADLRQNGMVDLERTDDATLTSLQRSLRRGEFHIFHFIGHGGFDERTQDGVLLLEDERGNGRPTSSQYLGTLLHDHRSLSLAVLNACEGARASRSDPFGGTAQNLVRQGLPAVLAMQFEITDGAALVLAREFYSAIADGYPVDAALAEARKAIFGQGNDIEWGTPVLYMRATDGRIFDIAPSSPEERQRVRVAALLHEAQAAMRDADWSAAIAHLDEVLALAPDHDEAAALRDQARQQAAAAAPPPPPPPPPEQPAESHASGVLATVREKMGRRSRQMSLGVLAVIVLVLIGAGVWVLQSSPDPGGNRIITPQATTAAPATATADMPATSTARAIAAAQATADAQATATAVQAAAATSTAAAQASATANAREQRVVRVVRRNWFSILPAGFSEAVGWPVGESVQPALGLNVQQEIVDNTYMWQFQAGRTVFFRTLAPIEAMDDFFLEVDMQQTSGPSNTRYGLVFRHINNGAAYYLFEIVDQERFEASIWHNDTFTPLFSVPLERGSVDASLRLAVLAEGARYSFFVDDTFIGEFQDERIQGGRVGMAVTLSQNTPDAAFAFNGFTLRAPTELEMEMSEPESTEIEPAQRPSPTPLPTATFTPVPTPTPPPYPPPADADDATDDEFEDD
jgi:hypothetical protein